MWDRGTSILITMVTTSHTGDCAATLRLVCREVCGKEVSRHAHKVLKNFYDKKNLKYLPYH